MADQLSDVMTLMRVCITHECEKVVLSDADDMALDEPLLQRQVRSSLHGLTWATPDAQAP